MCSCCALFSKLCFRLQVLGRENIPHTGGFILASNHVSHLDPILVGCLCPRQLHYFARISLFTANKLFGWLIASVNTHPIKRGEADRGALDLAEYLVKTNNGILLFPEGTRSKDGTIGPAKPGIGFIACRTSVPVIPAYVHNSINAMPRDSKKITCVPVSVYYGKPLIFSLDDANAKGATKEDYINATTTIMDAIRELKANAS